MLQLLLQLFTQLLTQLLIVLSLQNYLQIISKNQIEVYLQGAIVAIVVPCVAALISLGALSALYKSTPAVAAAVAPAQAGVPNDIDTSLVRMTLQNQPVVQEVPVVQQPSDVVQQTASVVKEAVEPVTVVNDTVV